GDFVPQFGRDLPSAANPKFAPRLPRVRLRTSGSKRHWNHRVASVLSIPKFASVVRQGLTNFGIGTLAVAAIAPHRLPAPGRLYPLDYCRSMMFSENRYPPFGIML